MQSVKQFRGFICFGIILYEWLTQKNYKAKTYHEWAVLHCQQLQIQLPKQLECFFAIAEWVDAEAG